MAYFSECIQILCTKHVSNNLLNCIQAGYLPELSQIKQTWEAQTQEQLFSHFPSLISDITPCSVYTPGSLLNHSSSEQKQHNNINSTLHRSENRKYSVQQALQVKYFPSYQALPLCSSCIFLSYRILLWQNLCCLARKT